MSIYEALKDAGELAQKYKQIELYEKLLSSREELADIREENLQLKTENKSLKENIEIREHLNFDKELYWYADDPMTNSKDPTPICPICFENKSRIFRLIIKNKNNGESFTKCKNCTNYFTIREGTSPGPNIVR